MLPGTFRGSKGQKAPHHTLGLKGVMPLKADGVARDKLAIALVERRCGARHCKRSVTKWRHCPGSIADATREDASTRLASWLPPSPEARRRWTSPLDPRGCSPQPPSAAIPNRHPHIGRPQLRTPVRSASVNGIDSNRFWLEYHRKASRSFRHCERSLAGLASNLVKRRHLLHNGPTFSGRAGTGRTLESRGTRRPPCPLERLVIPRHRRAQ